MIFTTQIRNVEKFRLKSNMLTRDLSPLNIYLISSLLLVGCAESRQIAVDYPTADATDSKSSQTTIPLAFQALPGYQAIDGDDYYVRLISEFNFKGENILKSGCDSITPSFSKNDLTSALVFTVRNDDLKFKNEVAGYTYQASTGRCNFKFDAKKQNLTPWVRLNLATQTTVDYSVYSSANSNVDVAGLVNKITATSNLLAVTGVGMGVAVLGQFAGEWFKYNQQTQTAPSPTANVNTESHTLPAIIRYSGNSGTMNETVFPVYAVAEGGMNILKAETKPLGELHLHPEIIPSLLLKTGANGVPDARDLSLSEISVVPIKSPAGDINLQQLIEQSKHPEKPNLKPDWNNYDDVQSQCRKLKIVMKDLGFNKFDRNAYTYYFLTNSNDWLNYNISPQKAQGEDLSGKILKAYRSKNFGRCLVGDDVAVMKSMGLAVNTESDWSQMGDTSLKKEQFFMPMKSIERQLLTVLKNPSKTEMESQIFPLLTTTKQGNGTVLLQNHLGDFGLEKLLQSVPNAPAAPIIPYAPKPVAASEMPSVPGEGTIVNAKQLVQVFSGLNFDQLSCARVIPEQLNQSVANTGIILFTTKAGSPRAKGGAMEFEFTGGKINRIAFQLPSNRDFEQHVIDNPEIGGCRIEVGFLERLH